MERVRVMSVVYLVVVMGLVLILHPLRGVYAADESENEWKILMNFKGNVTDPDGNLARWDEHCNNGLPPMTVICDDERKHVIKINLGHASLSGHLIPDLAKLTKLQHLMLFQNNLSGNVPEELTKIQYVDLRENPLLKGKCTQKPCGNP